jgi:hypothetical protein
MKFLYNPDLRIHTVHVHDVVRGLFTAAQWMSGLQDGRIEANRLAGVVVPNAWYRATEAERQGMETLNGEVKLVDKETKVVVPYFNLVCLMFRLRPKAHRHLGRSSRHHTRYTRPVNCCAVQDQIRVPRLDRQLARQPVSEDGFQRDGGRCE